MPKKTKKLLKDIILPVLSALLLAGGLVYAWSEPSVAPPGGNVSAPLNVGSLGQEKLGGLILNTGGALLGLIVDKGDVGIGTQNPQSPAPNSQPGNLDANDVYLRSVSQWASQSSGSVLSYTYYCFSDSSWGTPVCTDAGGTQGFCPSGYTQKLALGSWGRCYNSHADYHSDFFLPPGGSCGTVTGYNIGGNYVGDAYICSKVISEGWYVPSDIKTTTTTHDGNFGGYQAMNNWIQSNGCSGYHVCDSSEITRYYQLHPTTNLVGFYNTGYGVYYPPGGDFQQFDCHGWTQGLGTLTSGWSGWQPAYYGCGDSKVMCCK